MREKENQYDIIGDIHGRWDKLEPLLAKLGYEHNGQCHAHPDGRIAIFLGDLIDPKGDYPNGTFEVLCCVRNMVTYKKAHCILGNHEYNYVAYHMPGDQDGYMRPHNEKNKRMHAGTFESMGKTNAGNWPLWIDWFRSLPLFLDLPELRVVHACWHGGYIQFLNGRTLEDPVLQFGSGRKGSPEYLAIETLLKGVEVPMPDGHHFYDHQGNKRTDFRARWWDKETPFPTARNMLFPSKEDFPDTPLNPEDVAALPGYKPSEKPVFIGHYYKPGDSSLEAESKNLYCLDFSAAVDGPLVAFRWDGDGDLSSDKLVMIKEDEATKGKNNAPEEVDPKMLVESMVFQKQLTRGMNHKVNLMQSDYDQRLYACLTIENDLWINFYLPVCQKDVDELQGMEARSMMIRIMAMSMGRKSIDSNESGSHCTWTDYIYHPYA